jgi:two-component system chemotaxis response regulator CheY
MKTILICDDDEAIHKQLRAYLGKYRLLHAMSADEAVGYLANESVDLILLDQTMPGKTGLEALEEWPQTVKDIPPVIMISANSGLALAIAFFKASGASIDFLEKPFRPETLLPIVEKALTGTLPVRVLPKKIEIAIGPDKDLRGLLDRVEREYLAFVLSENDYNISNTARALGISRRGIQTKLQKHNIEKIIS